MKKMMISTLSRKIDHGSGGFHSHQTNRFRQ
jgi:hypothetical protein